MPFEDSQLISLHCSFKDIGEGLLGIQINAVHSHSAILSVQGDGDHRAHPGLAHKVPVLTSTHAPMFLPANLEQHEPGSPLSPRLHPVIILEPSLTHTPLVTGEYMVFRLLESREA